MNKFNLTTQVLEPFEQISRLYQQLEKTTDYYGTNQLLHPSEIHTIEEIGRHPKTSLTNLATTLGITKGSATKMVQKLVTKGLVTKEFAPDSENKIQINLTTLGKTAFTNHQKYLTYLNDQLSTIYESLSDSELELIIKIGNDTRQLLNKLIEERTR
ncbi:MarR family winged helix-turn-helix transcriptional regulator [Ligilactobacillus sp. WILCCON 0076]|uniref:MarR family winged helix-turn-helix transcriptional regulator n=1 Tax=Ligilactobacillus ubinensis TaxID=2876789 RepID=A0A9X2JLZ1_9LACO|nr:MarR family winged helix-turn-helix transcriptional regulator [Ligilactobacillus ubinensis]MCP0887384.1 MarR family winged helix-turn-helix transcriptional regulator [Ligilactobacillus ubinensis]